MDKDLVHQVVTADINLLSSAIDAKDSDLAFLTDLHITIDGKYRAIVDKWYYGCSGYTESAGINYESLTKERALSNLKMFRAELKGFLLDLNIKKEAADVITNISNVSSASASSQSNVSFETAINTVIEAQDFDEAAKNEILQKISEIEAANSDPSKNSKWEKLKKILQWICDKGIEVAAILLPLIIQVSK